MLTLCLFISNAQAAKTTAQIINSVVKNKPSSVKIDDASSSAYKARGATVSSSKIGGTHTYIGRNMSVVKANNYESVKSSKSMSRSIVVNNSNDETIQVESLESTAGELVQKIEDDRINKSTDQQSLFENNVTELIALYNKILDNVIRENLGSEQDPKIQNAFKCKNPEDCKKDISKDDDHKIPECSDGKRLHWNGDSWTCYGLFDTISNADFKCDDSGANPTQYSYSVNGQNVCENYTFTWYAESYGVCTPYSIKSANVVCQRHKANQDASRGVKVDNSFCYGNKPEMTQECTYTGPAVDLPDESTDTSTEETIEDEPEEEYNPGEETDWGWGYWDNTGDCSATDAALGRCNPNTVIECTEKEVKLGYCDVATDCTDAAASRNLCTQKCTESEIKKGTCDVFTEEKEEDPEWWEIF